MVTEVEALVAVVMTGVEAAMQELQLSRGSRDNVSCGSSTAPCLVMLAVPAVALGTQRELQFCIVILVIVPGSTASKPGSPALQKTPQAPQYTFLLK